MKNFFLTTFILFNLFLLPTLAVSKTTSDINKYKPQLAIKFGDTTINFDTVSCNPGETCSIGWIGQYIGAVYQYGVGLAAVLATIMIMVGGFLWLTSGGSPDRVGRAKEFITGSLTGLLLALFSFMILYTVNPRLVALEGLSIRRPLEIEIEADDGEQIPSGIAARPYRTVAATTDFHIETIPGAPRLDGLDPNAVQSIENIFGELARRSQLPEGLQITSGYRLGSRTANGNLSQHNYNAVDFVYNGLNQANANQLMTNIRAINPNVSFVNNINHGTGPHIHMDFRNGY